MKSWEVLHDAIEKVGVKALAARLNLSTALVYKWCQESPADDPGGSGARNPLDRLKEIWEITHDPRVVNWLCHQAGGFYVPNSNVEPGQKEEHLLSTTRRFVEEFGELLARVSGSFENDGEITSDEAVHIRAAWEKLKRTAECFVVASERGMYSHKRGA